MGQLLMVLWVANRKVHGAHKLWKAARRAGHDIGRTSGPAETRAGHRGRVSSPHPLVVAWFASMGAAQADGLPAEARLVGRVILRKAGVDIGGAGMSAEATDRPLTVLFTDVVGSTHLHVSAGDVLALEILDVHERMMNEGIARFGGRRIKSLGDGIMVAFDSPSRGVACALDVQRNLDEHNRLKPASTVRVRMGLNVGTVVERDGDLYGTTVIAAARVVSKARAGQVLVTSSIRGRPCAAGRCDVCEPGPVLAQGFS